MQARAGNDPSRGFYQEAPTGTSHGSKCQQALSHLRIFQDNICNKWALTHSENRHEISVRRLA